MVTAETDIKYTIRLTSIACWIISPLEDLVWNNKMGACSKEEIEEFFTKLKEDRILTSFTIGEEQGATKCSECNYYFLVEYEWIDSEGVMGPLKHTAICKRDTYKEALDPNDGDYPSELYGG